MGKKYKTTTYYVSGMHCAACELLIKNKLEESSNVLCAEANLADKTVTIQQKRGSIKGVEIYNNLLKDTGYLITPSPVDQISWNLNTMLIAGLTLGFVVLIYLFGKSQGYLGYVTVSETSTLPAFFVFGVVAGISSCAALVGGLLLSLSKQWSNLYAGNKSVIKKSTPFAMFITGRLLSFALLGGLLGLFGATLQLSITTTALLTLGVSFIMVVISLQMLGVSWANKIRLQLPTSITKDLSSANNFQGKYMPFLAGAGTFFLPCGFTLLAQTIALTTGSFSASALVMFVFALGTLPPLFFISASSIKFQNNPAFSGTFNFIVGIIILLFGAYNINSQLIVLGLPNVSTISKQPQIANTSQIELDQNGLGSEIITKDGQKQQNGYIRADGFEYFPRTLKLSAGIPTTLTINSDNVVGCAQAMYLRGLYNDIVYLNQPSQKISFTPKQGTYYISCTMGMVEPIVVTVI